MKRIILAALITTISATSAIYGIRWLRVRSAVERLVQAEDELTAERVAAELTSFGLAAKSELVSALPTIKRFARPAAAKIVVSMGSAGVLAIAERTSSSSPKEVREAAIEILGWVGTSARPVIPKLVEALADREVRLAAIEALGRLGQDASLGVPVLTEFLADNDSALAAARALGGIGPPARSAVPFLIRMLEAEPPQPATAAGALGQIGDPAAVEGLVSLLQPRRRLEDVEAAMEALGRIGPEAKSAMPRLMEWVWHDSLHDQAAAAASRVNPADTASIEAELKKYRALAYTRVDLISPRPGALIAGAAWLRWRIRDRVEGLRYCAVVLTDKGENPYDGSYEENLVAGSALQIEAGYGSDFDWAVEVTACRDSNARCKPGRTPCSGRVIRSDVRRVRAR